MPDTNNVKNQPNQRCALTDLENALVWATRWHVDQKDKCGRPYILHPLAVMHTVEIEQLGPVAMAVALLHDTVEDCPNVTIEGIRTLFGDEIATSVDALTRRKGETYFDYIRRVKLDRIGRVVKLADIADNRRPDRQCEKTKGMESRYLKALMILT